MKPVIFIQHHNSKSDYYFAVIITRFSNILSLSVLSRLFSLFIRYLSNNIYLTVASYLSDILDDNDLIEWCHLVSLSIHCFSILLSFISIFISHTWQYCSVMIFSWLHCELSIWQSLQQTLRQILAQLLYQVRMYFIYQTVAF